VNRYRRFLEEIRHQHGTVAFLSGDIPGLRPEEEERLLTGLGYARYGRSEMERTAESPLPPAELPPGCALRPVSRADGPELVELHARAYRHRFDRYLFLQDADEAADTRKLFDDLFGGRWGELSVAGCRGIERGGRLLGATLSVRRGPGALIIDLMVDPTVQGQGLGRTLLVETLRSLIAQREVPVKLTVTEGNTRAIGLYERLGFVRTLGPSHDWYDRSAIPVSPTD
jgi:ribosomal protein S18 acetylase RimI-like enzyme